MVSIQDDTLFTDANLKSYYPLNGSSIDIKGGRNGTDTSVVYSSLYGRYDQGGKFNGTSSITTATRPFDLPAALSIGCWINSLSLSQNAELIGINVSSPNYGYQICQSNGAGGAGAKLQYTFPAVANVDSGITITAGWHLVIMQRTGGVWTMYYDQTTAGTTSALTPQTPNGSACWGGSFEGGAYQAFFNGYIAEPFFFDKALTSAERSRIYNGGRGKPFSI